MFIFIWYHELNSSRRLLLCVPPKVTASVSPTDHRARIRCFFSTPRKDRPRVSLPELTKARNETCLHPEIFRTANHSTVAHEGKR